MISVATSAIKDHWSEWDETFVPPPPFNVEEFQAKLDEIAGLSRGKSILKLEWGGNAQIIKYTGWDAAGTPTDPIVRPRYAIPRRHQIMDYEMYIPIRRWIITERSEPEQNRPDDDFDNKFTDERGVVCKAGVKEREVYLPYVYVGDHSKCPKNCCETRICLGDYKTPDRAELNYLIQVTYDLKKDFFCDPYSPLTDAQRAQIRKEYNDEREKRLESDLNEFDDESKDIFKTHKHHLDDYNLKQPIYIYKDGRPI